MAPVVIVLLAAIAAAQSPASNKPQSSSQPANASLADVARANREAKAQRDAEASSELKAASAKAKRVYTNDDFSSAPPSAAGNRTRSAATLPAAPRAAAAEDQTLTPFRRGELRYIIQDKTAELKQIREELDAIYASAKSKLDLGFSTTYYVTREQKVRGEELQRREKAAEKAIEDAERELYGQGAQAIPRRP